MRLPLINGHQQLSDEEPAFFGACKQADRFMMTREDRHQQLDVLENKRRKGLMIRLYSSMVVGVLAVTLAGSGVAYTHLLQTVAICVL